MVIDIAAIKTQYQALGLLVTATNSAQSAIEFLGDRPTFGDIIATDPEYDDIVAAQVIYDAALLSAKVTFNTAVTTQKTAELAVTNLLPQNQWVRLTGLTNWIVATQYIGWPTPTNNGNRPLSIFIRLYTIYATNILPTQKFPTI